MARRATARSGRAPMEWGSSASHGSEPPNVRIQDKIAGTAASATSPRSMQATGVGSPSSRSGGTRGPIRRIGRSMRPRTSSVTPPRNCAVNDALAEVAMTRSASPRRSTCSTMARAASSSWAITHPSAGQPFATARRLSSYASCSSLICGDDTVSSVTGRLPGRRQLPGDGKRAIAARLKVEGDNDGPEHGGSSRRVWLPIMLARAHLDDDQRLPPAPQVGPPATTLQR